MAITRENIEHIAKLARLDVSGENFNKLAQDMQSIVAMVDKLQELNLGDIKDSIDTEHKNAFREDVRKQSYDREKLLSNAPVQEAGGVSVPKVVE